MKNDVEISRAAVWWKYKMIDAGKVSLQEEFSRPEMSSFSPQQIYDGSLGLKLNNSQAVLHSRGLESE